MKKIFALACICAIWASCEKDDPTESLNPNSEQTQGLVPDSNTNSDQPDVVVQKEDVSAYFGFDTSKDVNTALALTESPKGLREIGGKTIDITQTARKSKDEKAGSFILHVSGTVDKKPFASDFTFDGFLKKPEDYLMATRAQGKWKQGVDTYALFDFDYLYREKKTEKFTARYLSNVVDFYSSTTEGLPYPYTSEDIDKTVISDIQYTEGSNELSFVLTYSGIKSSTPIRLFLDKNDYYARKVQVNTEFVKGRYMAGVKKYYDIFGGNTVKYDTGLYAVKAIGANAPSSSGIELTLQFQLMPATGEDEVLATFGKEITGFKPMEDLKNELVANSTYEVVEVMKKYIKADTPAGDVKNRITQSVDVWIKKAGFSIRRNGAVRELAWADNQTVLHSTDGMDVMDVYLEQPRFELVSATLKEENSKHLLLEVKLIYANETALNDAGIVFTISVPMSF